MEVFVPPCVSTPEFIHAAMRPDVITETVVEVSTEESEPMDTSPIPTSPDSHEPMKKKNGRVYLQISENLGEIFSSLFFLHQERWEIFAMLIINVILIRYSQKIEIFNCVF